MDRLYENDVNSIDNNPNVNYDKSDKCQIKIVTNGVCSVNSHVIKPQILIKYSNKMKNYIPVYRKKGMGHRFRNMESFRIEEKKANALVDEFLIHYKEQFGQMIDPMTIQDFGTFEIKDLGNVKVYNLKLEGISNIKRDGSVSLHANSQMKLWSINANLSIANITADFKVDAKLKNRVYISGWALQVLIRKCLLNTVLEFDESTKMLTISSLVVNSVEGFALNTDNLSWPFNEVVSKILDHQREQLKTIISTNAEKYFSETLKSFDVSKIIDQMSK